jgi:hypothetical protein
MFAAREAGAGSEPGPVPADKGARQEAPGGGRTPGLFQRFGPVEAVRDRPALIFMLIVPILVVTIVVSTLGGSEAGALLLPVVGVLFTCGAGCLSLGAQLHRFSD